MDLQKLDPAHDALAWARNNLDWFRKGAHLLDISDREEREILKTFAHWAIDREAAILEVLIDDVRAKVQIAREGNPLYQFETHLKDLEQLHRLQEEAHKKFPVEDVNLDEI